MRLTTVVMFMVGGVLVYAAVKDKNPLDVFKMGIQGKAAPASAPKAAPAAANLAPSQVVTSV